MARGRNSLRAVEGGSQIQYCYYAEIAERRGEDRRRREEERMSGKEERRKGQEDERMRGEERGR